jgi:TRAP transporter TAXI family solute receptor
MMGSWRRHFPLTVRHIAACGVFALCFAAILDRPVEAQQVTSLDKGARAAAARPNLKTLSDQMNANTLTVVTGAPTLIYTAFGYDLAAVLNNGDELRVLPVISQGATQNVRDVRFLRGVDLGFAQTNILGHYRNSGEIGDLTERLVYIAKICNEEFHFIVRSNITSLEQLRGKKVNFNTAGSGTQLSARDIFRRLGITVEEVNMGPADGLEKLKNGEIAATVLTSGKPAPALARIKAADGYRILPVPFVKSLQDDYLPSTLTHEDYPDLIASGETIDTIASGTILFAYNWPKNSDRYRRIDTFVKAFFSKFAEFQKPPRHPKWRETNLASTIPGWKRFEGAEEWLATYRQATLSTKRKQFEEFLAERRAPSGAGQSLSERDRNQLFEDFIKWTGAREGR